MDIPWVVDLIKGATELANSARATGGRVSNDQDAQRVKALIEALRLIYFSPRGVVVLVEQLANGEKPTSEQIELVLPRFNDGEPFVDRMLHRLNPQLGHADNLLTLKAEKALREIANGKGGVRTRVKELLNEALTFDEDVRPEEAKELLDSILELNQAIENAEEELVYYSKTL